MWAAMVRPMLRLIAPHLTGLLVALSLIAPLGGGALAGLLGDARTVVICTGDGLRTLTLGEDGSPVETVDIAEICALVQAVDTASAAHPAQLRNAEFTTLASAMADHAIPRQAPALPSLPRAPPLG